MTQTPDAINLTRAFASIREYFQPRIAAEVNDVVVKLTKIKGEFIWHRHETEDELFLVLKGELRMCLRDGDKTIREGELLVVPRGVEHKPMASEEVHVLLVEPRTTVNTGDSPGPLTQSSDLRL